MEFTISTTTRVNIDTVRVTVPVNYDDEDIPHNFPFRDGDTWSVDIDMGTGRIRDWPKGVAHSLHMKVIDQGEYLLLADGDCVLGIDGDYVPHGVVPGEYGDYIVLEIGADGVITNWPTKPDISEFIDSPSTSY